MSDLTGRKRAPWLVILSVATVGMSVVVTMMYLAMRAVLEVGGTCGDGGPYVVRNACPQGVGEVLAACSIGLIVFGMLMGVSAAKLWVPQIVLLAWPALFLSLGWNFLEDGTGQSGNKGSLICGIFFMIMGAGPFIVAFPWVRRTIGNREPAPGPRVGNAELLQRVNQILAQAQQGVLPDRQAHQQGPAQHYPFGVGSGQGVLTYRNDHASSRSGSYYLLYLVLVAPGIIAGAWSYMALTGT